MLVVLLCVEFIVHVLMYMCLYLSESGKRLRGVWGQQSRFRRAKQSKEIFIHIKHFTVGEIQNKQEQ